MKKINFKKFGRVMVFIDNANIIYSLKDLGWRLSYKRLQKYFQKKANLVDIYFYTATRKEDTKQENFLAMLSRKGFKLRVKEVKFIPQPDGTKLMKGNCDVELTIDTIDLLRKYDTAVLMSGDSDFAALVNYIRNKGKRAVVISTRKHISHELVKAADTLIYFNRLRRVLELR